MEKEVYTQMAAAEELHWWYKARKRIIEKVLETSIKARNMPSSLTILDIGCGTGGNYPSLSKYGKVTGVETDLYAIDIAKKKFPGLKIIQGNLPNLSQLETENNKKYDCITLLDVLEHIEEENEALLDIKNLIADNGMLLITVPAFMFLWSKSDTVAFHKRRYTKKLLKNSLENAGYKICFLSYFNFFLFFPAFLGKVYINSKKKYKASEEMTIPNNFLNEIIYQIFRMEALFLPYFKFPFGISLIAVAEKMENISGRNI